MPRNTSSGLTFRSPGAAFGDALEDLMIQRKLEARQKMQDDIDAKERVALAERQQAQLELQRAQEKRIGADSQRNADALEKERQYIAAIPRL